jgi:hypothetical protein
MKTQLNHLLGAILLLLLPFSLSGQISIISTNFNSLNVTPVSLCQANIMNAGGEVSAVIQATIYNSANEKLLDCKTMPFVLKQGLSNVMSIQLSLEYSIFGTSAQASFIRTNHTLPSGNYKYCINVIAASSETGDDYCEEIQSELNSFLYLIDPFDHDTISASHPMLIWTHSEPFNVLAQGEYFRLVLVELLEGQNAESGVSVNIPVFEKSYVSSHQVQHPFDLKELEQGKRYGWQIQKFSNGMMVQKSEAWEFVIASDITPKDIMYAVMKKTVDGGFYTAKNNRVFFQFNESYILNPTKCVITDERGKTYSPNIYAVTKSGDYIKVDEKQSGNNRFVIQLAELGLKKGYYTLSVKNSKGETYYLKFYVE